MAETRHPLSSDSNANGTVVAFLGSRVSVKNRNAEMTTSISSLGIMAMSVRSSTQVAVQNVSVGSRQLPGILSIPDEASGLVVFAHGSGSSRFSPRNQSVARSLHKHGFATLLFDLLSENESQDRCNVFDIELLTSRLCEAIDWAASSKATERLPIGLFGASTGSAAALMTAARRQNCVAAVVSRGRPDLAIELAGVKAPTLLIVGSRDATVVELNQAALRQMHCIAALEIVPGATHLFSEPGTLQQVACLAANWFKTHFLSQLSKGS
jgi:pimeloyl-ACP methyl ester carboxylesterase